MHGAELPEELTAAPTVAATAATAATAAPSGTTAVGADAVGADAVAGSPSGAEQQVGRLRADDGSERRSGRRDRRAAKRTPVSTAVANRAPEEWICEPGEFQWLPEVEYQSCGSSCARGRGRRWRSRP